MTISILDFRFSIFDLVSRYNELSTAQLAANLSQNLRIQISDLRSRVRSPSASPGFERALVPFAPRMLTLKGSYDPAAPELFLRACSSPSMRSGLTSSTFFDNQNVQQGRSPRFLPPRSPVSSQPLKVADDAHHCAAEESQHRSAEKPRQNSCPAKTEKRAYGMCVPRLERCTRPTQAVNIL
jgi:hypothetical protein